MNETTTQTEALSAGDLAMRQLHHVGGAYLFLFVLLFAYAWRIAAGTKRLSDRVDELERERGR